MRNCVKSLILFAFLLNGIISNAQIIRSVRMPAPEIVFDGMDNSKYTVLDSCRLEFSYRFEFPRNENDTSRTLYDDMVLQVGEKYSKYFSKSVYKVDCECSEHSGDPMFFNTPKNGAQCYEVFTCILKGNMLVTNRLPASMGVIKYEEPIHRIEWSMGAETKEILGHTCFNATATVFGRDYEVWFTPDIPVSVGPWKLHGLPGAVLMAEDSGHLFRFECVGISTQKDAVKFYDWDYTDKSKEEYLKFEKNMYLHAGAYLNGSSIRMTIIDNSEKGYHKLSDEWSAFYCPLEVGE